MSVTKIPRRGSKKSFGKFPSKKDGRLVCWWSKLQRDYLYLLEADQSVTRYEEQPRVIQYMLGGRVRRYTPSFEVERNGRVYVVEVRPADKVAAAADFEAFRREMARVCRQQGLGRFVVLTEADIRQQPLLDNGSFSSATRARGSRSSTASCAYSTCEAGTKPPSARSPNTWLRAASGGRCRWSTRSSMPGTWRLI